MFAPVSVSVPVPVSMSVSVSVSVSVSMSVSVSVSVFVSMSVRVAAACQRLEPDKIVGRYVRIACASGGSSCALGGRAGASSAPSWECLFFQNATQVQLHGGKTPIVLFFFMNAQVSRVI